MQSAFPSAVDAVIQTIAELHDTAASRLRADIAAFAQHGTLPPPSRRSDGSYCYPELQIHYSGRARPERPPRAYGRLNQPGTYAATIARPALFADYLADQLCLIAQETASKIEGL